MNPMTSNAIAMLTEVLITANRLLQGVNGLGQGTSLTVFQTVVKHDIAGGMNIGMIEPKPEKIRRLSTGVRSSGHALSD